MHVVVAQEEDRTGWLALAAEVEALCEPVHDDSDFRRSLARTIKRGSAFCVRANDGPPGTPLLGGLLFSTLQAPIYRLNWLAVTAPARQQGIARQLVAYASAQVARPATLAVLTFGPTHPNGAPARHFYRAMGFTPAELTPGASDGFPRQIYRRYLS